MSNVNGMKLGVNKTQIKQQHIADFDNEFLQNQQVQPNVTQQKSDIKNEGVPDLLIDSDVKIIKNKSSEIKRIKKLNNGMQKLSVSILQMRQNCNDIDVQQMLFKKRNQKKQQEIKAFLLQKKNQKIQMKKKRSKRLQKQAKSLEQSINLQKQQKQKKKVSLVQQSLSRILQNKRLRQLQKSQNVQRNKKIQQMYSKIHKQQKGNPKFHLRKLQEDKKKSKQKQMQQKQYLAKRRQNFKPLNMNQIDQHSKRHQQLLSQLQTVKKGQKQQQILRIVEHNKKIQQFYRGRNYDNVLQQLNQKKVRKDQPLQKYKKIKNYQDYVRQNFVPKTQQKSKQDTSLIDEKHSSLSHREIRRYRYLQGVSYGQVIENRPLACSQMEQKKLGNNYMAYMRSLPKRKHDSQQSVDFSQNAMIHEKIKQKKPNPLSQRKGRKSLQVKISQKPTRQQLNMVINQLKNNDVSIQRNQKLVKYASQSNIGQVNIKKIGSDLINNIERKLNLLSKL